MNIPIAPETPAPDTDNPALPPDEPEPVPEQDPPGRDPAPIGDPPDEQAPMKADR
ncbi:hypothetical protein NTD86_22535 [Pseudomonas sp. 7P_10.2_Bac1]|uniref:hypothetical protein n=1 Tax=Pseudomonas sp. 7P_10.2_Bac1 TaxID=2971614 RepID=UPI0021C5C38A|nr:hypothetical protein [Pseudomonas sp. 7P_10.2_Bac1]MCU1729748.1 hypothetical protein [Pseudomonas sp. 7P_10.2_Bac1]